MNGLIIIFNGEDHCTTALTVISRSECDEKSYLFQSLKISPFGRNDKNTSCAKVLFYVLDKVEDMFHYLHMPIIETEKNVKTCKM
jgi:hypothetical protein